MNGLDPQTEVKQADDVISREVSGQLVLLTPATGTIHELDEVGCYIWSLCERPRTIAALTASIVQEYDVEQQVAAADLSGFIAEMIAIGAIRAQ